MTAKEINRMQERCRTRRRNLKRYLYTQSFFSLTGKDYRVGGQIPVAQERSRSMLGVVSVVALGIGLFFVVF